jgi:hypothetical protein
MGNELDSLRGDGGTVQKLYTDHEVEDYLEPSMLGRSIYILATTLVLLFHVVNAFVILFNGKLF